MLRLEVLITLGQSKIKANPCALILLRFVQLMLFFLPFIHQFQFQLSGFLTHCAVFSTIPSEMYAICRCNMFHSTSGMTCSSHHSWRWLPLLSPMYSLPRIKISVRFGQPLIFVGLDGFWADVAASFSFKFHMNLNFV